MHFICLNAAQKRITIQSDRELFVILIRKKKSHFIKITMSCGARTF